MKCPECVGVLIIETTSDGYVNGYATCEKCKKIWNVDFVAGYWDGYKVGIGHVDYART